MQSPPNNKSHRAFLSFFRESFRLRSSLSSGIEQVTRLDGQVIFVITQTFGFTRTGSLTPFIELPENISLKLRETKLTRGHGDDERHEYGQ
jgi:hypothetical protein